MQGANFQVHQSSALVTRLAAEMVAGRIRVPPITRVRLHDTPQMLSAMRTGGADGKTVVIPGQWHGGLLGTVAGVTRTPEGSSWRAAAARTR